MSKGILAALGIGLGVALVASATSGAQKRRRRRMDPNDPCFPSTRFRAVHSSGVRSLDGITVIVVHDTEGGPAGAASSAAWFANPASRGSTQLIAGEDGTFRSLPDDTEPWAAEGANSNGLHIELAGSAAWTRAQWLARTKTLDCAARLIADWCFTYDIPAVLLDAASLRANQRGITTHAAVSEAFHQSNHYDPGPNFPMDVLIAKVQAALADLPYV
jgi:hypothetical protein